MPAARRTAWGQLLPGVRSSLSASYREGRQQYFGGVPIGASVDIVSSGWGLSADVGYGLGTMASIRRAEAPQRSPKRSRASCNARETAGRVWT